jgi:hypothetical protein
MVNLVQPLSALLLHACAPQAAATAQLLMQDSR